MVVLFVIAVVYPTARASGKLNLICRHPFRSADLVVVVDGKTTLTQQITGTSKKRFGFIDKRVEGSFSKALVLPSGEHVVQVRLTSAADGYNQSKRVGSHLTPQGETTLAIGAQRSSLSTIYQGPPVSPVEESCGGYTSYARSILVTVFGSAVSAFIGFMVQEFLKSRKEALK